MDLVYVAICTQNCVFEYTAFSEQILQIAQYTEISPKIISRIQYAKIY